MKRNAVFLTVLASVLITAVAAEMIYSAKLTDELTGILERCESAESDSERKELCAELMNSFYERESVNELFFTKKLIEKINLEISDMKVCAASGDSDGFEAALGRLRIYTEHIYFAGIF